jgi:hypothetical protein
MFISLNNNIICKPHNLSGGLKSEVKSGLAFVKQKQDVIGLEVLLTSRLVEGENISTIPAGSIVYIREERISTMVWGKTIQSIKTSGTDKGVDCILIPGAEVVGVELKEEAEASE